jgi:hypothetical protein
MNRLLLNRLHRLTLTIAIALPFAAMPMLASAHTAHADAAAPMTHDMAASPAPSKLAQTLRTLWLGHVEAVRGYVFAAHEHNAAKSKAAGDRVVANAKQIAGAVGSFYGKPAGDQMLTLLAGHWGAVKAYTDATFAHDDAGRTQAMQNLNANAKDIADFLSGANPNLPQATLLSLLTAHGAHHIAQIQEVESGDKAGEAKTWDAMRAHMLVIADALAGGIAKQFPDKVKG